VHVEFDSLIDTWTVKIRKICHKDVNSLFARRKSCGLEETAGKSRDYAGEMHATKVEIEQSDNMLLKIKARGKRASTVA
jgi:hypothetical protein